MISRHLIGGIGLSIMALGQTLTVLTLLHSEDGQGPDEDDEEMLVSSESQP